jgi:histidine triad (HIT) family protein
MTQNNPFVAIIKGVQPGTIIHKDDNKRFALIEDQHPEAAVHWLAITYEEGTTEELELEDRDRFLDLIDYAINTTKAQAEAYPILQQGFTIKFHCGAFETIEHPKLHVLSTE